MVFGEFKAGVSILWEVGRAALNIASIYSQQTLKVSLRDLNEANFLVWEGVRMWPSGLSNAN